MMAADPNRSRMSSRAASRALGARAIERQRELNRAVVLEVAEGHPDERDAPALDHRHRPRRAALSRWRGSSGSAPSPRAACAIESLGRSRRSASRSMTVRQTRRAARSRRATRSTSPTSTASRAPDDLGERPSARWAPIERRRRPAAHPPGIAVVGERVEVAARRPARASRRAPPRRAGRPRRRSRCPGRAACRP